jgi:hypothetical protein
MLRESAWEPHSSNLSWPLTPLVAQHVEGDRALQFLGFHFIKLLSIRDFLEYPLKFESAICPDEREASGL